MDARVVVEGGAIVHEEGDRSDVPWWSVTKMAIAAAALSLVGEGRLALDARLADRPYTLRQLLQHRAGLRDYGPLPAYQEAVARHEDAWPAAVMLERAKADQLVYEPGKNWDEPMYNVFRKDADGVVRHVWGSEILYAPEEPGQHHRAGDLVDPVWGLLDMSPEGRGDFFPKLRYA